jgi:hypothetical protein
MKSTILIFMLTATIGCSAVFGQNYDFRKTRWGMNMTQVKNAESSKLITSKKNQLIYSGKLSDWETEVVYNFTNSDQLYHAAYLINLESKNPQTYVDAFLLLQDLLTQVYKVPDEKRYTTINGKVIDEGEWASNLISDNLYLETRWETPRTKIALTLTNINDNLYLEINYTSVEHEKLMNKENRDEILKEL